MRQPLNPNEEIEESTKQASNEESFVSFVQASDEVMTSIKTFAGAEYFLAVVIIVLGRCGLSLIAYVLMALFLSASIRLQHKWVEKFRQLPRHYDYFAPLPHALAYLDAKASFCGLALPASRAAWTLVTNMPTSVQALSTALVVGQSLRPEMWGERQQDLWSRGWWFLPPIGWLGLPLTLLLFKIFGYGFALRGGFRALSLASSAQRKMIDIKNSVGDVKPSPSEAYWHVEDKPFWKNLAHTGDCLNFLIFSEMAHRVAQHSHMSLRAPCSPAGSRCLSELTALCDAVAVVISFPVIMIVTRFPLWESLDDNDTWNNRSERFLTKVLIGASGQLWLKVSLFGTTFDQLLDNPVELANLCFGIACSYYAIFLQLPAQFRCALWNFKNSQEDVSRLQDRGKLFFIRTLVAVVLILCACTVRLLGVFFCDSHCLNLTSGCISGT